LTDAVAQTLPSGADAVLDGSPEVTPLYSQQMALLSKQELLIDVVSANIINISLYLKKRREKKLTTKISIDTRNNRSLIDLDVSKRRLARILRPAVTA